MKKLLLITTAVLTFTTSAHADEWRRYNHHGGGNGGALIGGLIGGMILGGILAQPRQQYYQPEPQYYQPEPQCWRQRFVDNYGRVFVREVCNYGDN